jgi:hypothetical protein
VECALVQAALWNPDTWAPLLKDMLTLGDFREHVNLMTWRAFLLEDGDLVGMGRSLREDLSQAAWEKWVDRYCGGFETFRSTPPPVEDMFELLRADDDAELVGFCRRWFFI